MVTGASTADVAVILIDARRGVLTQTRRHSYLVSLLGIRKIALAVNKLDIVEYSREVFERIEADYRSFAAEIGLEDITAIPMSALRGDNVVELSERTPWYDGPSLIEYLETVEVDDVTRDAAFRMPVQWVNRPNLDFRGFSGLVVSGSLKPGDRVRVLPSGQTSTVDRLVTLDGDLNEVIADQAVTVTLADEIDVSRGDVIAAADDPPLVADQFEAHVVWMSEEPLTPGRQYLLKLGTRTVGARLAVPKHRINVNTLEHVAAKTLELNEIGVCTLTLDRAVPFDHYRTNRDMGGFVLTDRLTNATVAAGMLDFELRRSQNIHWQAVEVDKQSRAALGAHRPCVVWFTGLSGAGKSCIANLVEKRLHADGVRTYLLDGDNVRHGLNKDLGFTDADRIENMRRVAEVARLMVDAGLVVLVSFISPFRAERDQARALVADGEFCEVFVDTPLEVAEARDVKGLYKKARAGQLAHFTGIDSPYEAPAAPEVRVDTTALEPDAACEAVIRQLRTTGIL
jgi:bifunctional enzyme CysN/CysC